MQPEQNNNAIHLSHLTRRFGKTAAVDDVTLQVKAGSICGFVGLNGAGKTTTIRMMVGLIKPSGGVAEVAGCTMPAQRDQSRRLIGYVPDRPTVYGWMTGHQAVAFCRSIYGSQWNDARVGELLRALRIDLTKPISKLSKGSAAKISLLLAVAHDPRVLILDEPTSGFDVLAREEFLEGVLTVRTEAQAEDAAPRTIFFSSHALSDVQRLADTVAIMHHGRLLLHEPIESLLSRTKRIRTVRGETTARKFLPAGTVREVSHGREWSVTVKNFSDEQVQFLREKNSVGTVSVEDLTLEQVFREYVRDDEPIAV